MFQVPDLAPQNKYENLTNTLKEIAETLKPKLVEEKLDEQAWLTFINDHLQDIPETYGPDQLNENELKTNDFTWSQNEKFISITLLTPKGKVEVDQEKINSPVLKGLWWGPVTNLEILAIGEGEENEMVQITFDTEYHWPTLVKGGQPDSVSAYFISLAALALDQRDFFAGYLNYSANNGCATSVRAYALLLVDAGRYEESAYWNIQSVVQYADLLCGHVLARLLISGRGVQKDARLAEYILCRILNEGFTDAFFSLGELYLDGDEGVDKNEEKAKFLLLLSAYQLGDERAMNLIEERGLVKQSELDNDEIEGEQSYDENGNLIMKPIGENGEENGENNEEGEEDKKSIVDWAIAGGVVASVGAVGLYAFNKIFKRH